MEAVRSNVLTLLSPDYSVNDDNFGTLREFIHLTKTFQAFRDKNDQTLPEAISYAHSCINASKSRLKGLLLLHQILDQCDTATFQEHATSWSQMLINILKSFDTDTVHQVAAVIMSELLSHSVTFPVICRDFATSLIPGLIPTLLDAIPEWQFEAFICLRVCLQCFPGACSTFKNKIETKLIHSLLQTKAGTKQQSVISECYSLLAVCGGGSKRAEGWSLYLDMLIGSLHETLDGLYADLETDADNYRKSKCTLFPVQSDKGDVPKMHKLVHYYSALASTLSVVLRPDTNLTIHVPVDDILALICRSLSVSPKFLVAKPTHQRTLLCSFLPEIYRVTLLVLKSLITCLEKGLIVHCSLINKLFLQVLDSVAGCDDNSTQEHMFSETKQMLYDVASAWLSVAGAASSMVTISKQFIHHIISDSKPCENTVETTDTSKLLEAAEKVLRKRKKGKSLKTYLESSWQLKVNKKANWKLCVQALKALEQLIMHCGTQLKPLHHKEIQDFIIPLLLRVSQDSEPVVPPYVHPECRFVLYKVLEACILVPSPLWPPPIHMALAVFRKAAVYETDLKTRSYCHHALVVCQNLIHPRLPPLVAPPSIHQLLDQYLESSNDKGTVQPVAGMDRRITSKTSDLVASIHNEQNVEDDNAAGNEIQNNDIQDLVDRNQSADIMEGGSEEDDGDDGDDDSDEPKSITAEQNEEREIELTSSIKEDIVDETKNNRPAIDGTDSDKEMEIVSSQNRDPGNGDLQPESDKTQSSIQNHCSGSADSNTSASLKRKLVATEKSDVLDDGDKEPEVKKHADDLHLMLESFVDADPDEDD